MAFKKSIYTEMIIRTLKKEGRDYGTLVTWGRLCEVTGLPLLETQAYCRTARRCLMNDDEDKLFFVVIRGEGLARADPDDTHSFVYQDIEHQRLKNRRNDKILRTVDYKKMTPEQRANHNTLRGRIHLMYVASSRAVMKKVRELVNDQQDNQLPDLDRLRKAMDAQVRPRDGSVWRKG
jgi:hypothetical protein